MSLTIVLPDRKLVKLTAASGTLMLATVSALTSTV